MKLYEYVFQNTRSSNSSSSRDASPIRARDWPLPDLVDQSERRQMENVQSENQREFGSFLAYRCCIHVNHDLNLVNSGIVSGPSSPSITISPLALQPNPTFSFPDNPRPSWELKRREAVWDLFQSESAFLRDHLMALKNVTKSFFTQQFLLEVFLFRFSWNLWRRFRLKDLWCLPSLKFSLEILMNFVV